MSFLSCAHTHSTYCDGKYPVREMIDAATQCGFVSLGFSGHAAQGFDFPYSMSYENQRGYFDELRALQKEKLPLRLWAGLEVDAFAGEKEHEMSKEADYIIGSTHYMWAERGGDSVAVDGDPVKLKAHVDAVYKGDGIAAAKRYFEVMSDFILRAKPDIIGHFDLVRKYAQKLDLFDENDPAYRKIALNALEKSFPAGSVLEINTGGIARGYLPTPYPTMELLCAWREMGGRVTITSDCHDWHFLTHAYDMAEDMMKQAGFKSVMMLGTGEELWEEIPLSHLR